MEKRTRRIRTRKRKGKIKITESARLVEKNDKTSVKRPNMQDTIPIAPTPMPRSNGAVFKVKIKRK